MTGLVIKKARGSKSNFARHCDCIDHVALVAENITEGVGWLRRNFACEIIYQDATFALLQFQNVKISLVIRGQHPPHIAVIRDDAEEFGDLVTHRDETRSVYIVDPFQNVIEVQSAASPARE